MIVEIHQTVVRKSVSPLVSDYTPDDLHRWLSMLVAPHGLPRRTSHRAVHAEGGIRGLTDSVISSVPDGLVTDEISGSAKDLKVAVGRRSLGAHVPAERVRKTRSNKEVPSERRAQDQPRSIRVLVGRDFNGQRKNE